MDLNRKKVLKELLVERNKGWHPRTPQGPSPFLLSPPPSSDG